jgi:hypothetical protein
MPRVATSLIVDFSLQTLFNSFDALLLAINTNSTTAFSVGYYPAVYTVSNLITAQAAITPAEPFNRFSFRKFT